MELVTSFPDWVPKEALRTAWQLTEKEAASQLAVLLKLNRAIHRQNNLWPGVRRRVGSALRGKDDYRQIGAAGVFD
jgi:hypothetical protein